MNRPRFWLIGLALLGLAALLLRGSSAAQEKRNDHEAKWEYKVFIGTVVDTNWLQSNLNKEGSDGWEYAGSINNVSSGGGNTGIVTKAFVILKRPKR